MARSGQPLYEAKVREEQGLMKLVAVTADIMDTHQLLLLFVARPYHAALGRAEKMPNYSSKLTTFPLPVY